MKRKRDNNNLIKIERKMEKYTDKILNAIGKLDQEV